MSASACYDQDCLLAWSLGRLDAQRFEEVSAHLEQCRPCQQAVAAFDRVPDDLVQLIREPPPALSFLGENFPASTAAHRSGADTAAPAASPKPPFPQGLPGIEVGALLGKGGMGHVYQGRHVRLNRPVAVKVISQAVTHGDAAHKRFEREMQVLAKLDHPNVIRIFHADEANGRLYLVMELVEGVSLTEHVRQRGPLPVAEACDLARQAALGLHHAHERGAAHRDVKPGNLMVTRAGGLKVLDLGLARWLLGGEGADGATAPGVVMGTPGWMAPEQVSDPRSAGAAADVFSLGCTLYFLLAGQEPFPGGTVTERLEALARMSPKPLAALRPDCPAEVVKMVATMMAKDPKARITSAGLVAEKLAPFCRAASSAVNERSPLPSGAPKRRRVVWAAVALAAAALGLALWLGAVPSVRVKTPQGTLVLRFPHGVPATAEVLVDGSRVTLKGIDAQRGEVTLDAGARTLEVRDGKAVYRQDKVQIKRDQATVVEVTLDRSTAVAQLPRGAAPAVEDGPVGEIANMAGGVDTDLVRFSPTARFALTWDGYGPLRIWDLEKRRLLYSWGQRIYSPPAIFTLDGRFVVGRLIVGAPGLGVSDPTTGKTVGKLIDDPKLSSVHDISYSADGKWFLTAKNDGFLQLWGLPAGKQHREFKHGHVAVTACLTPDGKYILSGGVDGVMRLWDIEKDRQEKTYEEHGKPVVLVRLFGDGDRFVSVSRDGKAIVWDLKSGKQLVKLNVHDGGRYDYNIYRLAVAPEGRRLLAGHLDGSISVWNLDTGEKVSRLAGHKKGLVRAVDITPDGRHALSVGADQLLRYWRLPAVRDGKALPNGVVQPKK